MRTITLNKMHIANFKGIQDLEITLDGKNTLIAGYNGTGKSTIADAYFWAVTGKNTASETRFEVRPRNEQGNEVHDVITSVEIEFSVAEDNGDAFTFSIRRDELEDMTKKEREQLKPETKAKKKSYYFIDNAPYDEKTFYAQLAKVMCDKDKFAVLSNPYAFFVLDEKVQRDLLTAACGDVADSEVDGYDEVKAICGAINTPTTTRDSLKKSISATKKRLEEIPARVDSLTQLCDEHADYDKQIAELEKEQSEVHEQGIKLKDEIASKFGASSIKLPQPPSDSELERAKVHFKTAQMCLGIQTRKLQDAINQQEKSKCPNCGWMLDDKNSKIELIEIEIQEAQKDLEQTKDMIKIAQAEYDADMQEYNAKIAEQSKADEAVVQERKSLETCIDKLRARYTELSVEIEKLRNAQKIQSQIKSLRDEQRKLDDQLADDMTKLDMIEAFILRKAERVVENINKRFTTVKFKLFEMQTNSELKPCCKAMKDGVSYSNINTASKAQVGIELSKLFSEFYGVTSPIFIDCAESIFDIPQTNAQIIRLKADETLTDKKLHIEVE